MDSETWLAEHRRRLTALTARVGQARDDFEQAVGTATDRTGSVTVTVHAGGELRAVRFAGRAEELSHPRLAEAVLEAAREARVLAARRAGAALRPVVGGTEAERFLAELLPPDPGAAS
jgi:hypothetical protein